MMNLQRQSLTKDDKMDKLRLKREELDREYALGMTAVLNRKAMIILDSKNVPVFKRQQALLDVMMERGIARRKQFLHINNICGIIKL